MRDPYKEPPKRLRPQGSLTDCYAALASRPALMEDEMASKKLCDRLVVALGLALEEIHNPGASRSAGFDIIALCEGIIKEAVGSDGVPQMIQDEMQRRASL